MDYNEWVEQYKQEIAKECRMGFIPEDVDHDVLTEWYNEGYTPAQAADEEMTNG